MKNITIAISKSILSYQQNNILTSAKLCYTYFCAKSKIIIKMKGLLKVSKEQVIHRRPAQNTIDEIQANKALILR